LTLDFDSPVPLHRQLTEILREQISTGALRSRIPSVRTLAQEYGVSSRTSAQSLKTLQDEGVIIAVIGKGFYVNRNRS
jgi:DNA-binding GntR family transcriptional regulator